MSALYAFCREVDDIADEETRPVSERRAALQEWRWAVQRACSSNPSVDIRIPVVQELQPVIHRYRLPFHLFDQLLQGVEMDLEVERYDSRADLETYCYHVASVVGLLSIEIFGYKNPQCKRYADSLGKALQLTNILRDVGGDAQRGRVYLPTQLLSKHCVSAEDILRGRQPEGFHAVASEVAEWARYHYKIARELLPPEDVRRMIAAELMGTVYWKLLMKLEERRFAVLSPTPIKLTKSYKLALTMLAWLRVKTGVPVATYG